jgi:hypothetical protein
VELQLVHVLQGRRQDRGLDAAKLVLTVL